MKETNYGLSRIAMIEEINFELSRITMVKEIFMDKGRIYDQERMNVLCWEIDL